MRKEVIGAALEPNELAWIEKRANEDRSSVSRIVRLCVLEQMKREGVDAQ